MGAGYHDDKHSRFMDRGGESVHSLTGPSKWMGKWMGEYVGESMVNAWLIGT